MYIFMQREIKIMFSFRLLIYLPYLWIKWIKRHKI